MAGWITHMRIADEVMKRLPWLDRTGFCMGSIAPDCNVENEDWTAFTPPREVTHWMTGKIKLFSDCETFYDQRVQGRDFTDEQERSFYLGYYAHLIADVAYIHFLRDEERVANMWQRIHAVPELAAQAEGFAETYQTIKQVFGKARRDAALVAMENAYLYAHPETAYLTVLQTVRDFPDYLDFLPPGALLRKIGVLGTVPEKHVGEIKQVFFTREEFEGYVAQTCEEVIKRISSKI